MSYLQPNAFASAVELPHLRSLEFEVMLWRCAGEEPYVLFAFVGFDGGEVRYMTVIHSAEVRRNTKQHERSRL